MDEIISATQARRMVLESQAREQRKSIIRSLNEKIMTQAELGYTYTTISPADYKKIASEIVKAGYHVCLVGLDDAIISW